MSWINRIMAALMFVCVIFSAFPAIAQPYWCPVCGGNTHHYDGHPHFDPPSNGGGTTRPRSNSDGVVTIYNRSSRDLSYHLQRSPGGAWSQRTLKPGRGYFYFEPLPASFRIQFDSSRASGNQRKTYNLSHNVVKRGKATADAGRPYHFKEDSQGIRFHTSSGKTTTTRPTRISNNPFPVVPPVNDVWRRQQELVVRPSSIVRC